MERNANYALVGLISSILLVGLVVFVSGWPGSVLQRYDIYDIAFRGPVRGLATGGEVHFNGIKVGEVTKHLPGPRQPHSGDRPRPGHFGRADPRRLLRHPGAAGHHRRQLHPDQRRHALAPTAEGHRAPPAGDIRAAQPKRALSDLLEGGGTVLQRSVEALDRVNRLCDENIKTCRARPSAMSRSVTAELKEHKELITDTDTAVKDTDTAAKQITALRNDRESGRRRRQDASQNLPDAAGEMKGAAHQSRDLLANLDGPATDFATTGLPELTSAISSLRRPPTPKWVLGEAESNPQGVIYKPPAKEIEVKP